MSKVVIKIVVLIKTPSNLDTQVFLPFNIKLLIISLINRYCKLFCKVAPRVFGTRVA